LLVSKFVSGATSERVTASICRLLPAAMNQYSSTFILFTAMILFHCFAAAIHFDGKANFLVVTGASVWRAESTAVA